MSDMSAAPRSTRTPSGRRLPRSRREPSPTRIAALIGALALVAATVGASAQPASVVVEDWSRQTVGKTGVPDGWKAQNWGSPTYDFRIVAEGNGKVLHMKSDNEGSTINKEVKIDLRTYPVVEWRWKAVVLPKGADSRKKETDDQAAQLYVAFPRFPTAVRSRIIGYVWDTTAPAGLIAKSEKTGTVTYVIMRSGSADLGKWITESRNVLEDYKKIYGEEPTDPVGAVSVAIDSNDVKGTAESYMGEIRFRKP
jgi:DUF3047 family protein